ncbi:hypothetical protein QIS99_01795 [Streptomyces sp. B-S-A8]|uniref:Uncharacterized protein n=1 Tax=Streptomyces solicavernae TaxID=3043614 RepID=A0ABT6RKK3_9ACTN|nr:hypothetical protein [Streptomyces sp. B-S-A8]MDI3384952.1 hypothetical protein [Streptomyces sp. B-S-A8]
MPKTSSSVTAAPDTTWLGHGRHLGPEPEKDVRRNLIALKSAGLIDDFLDLAPDDSSPAGVGGRAGPPDPFASDDDAAVPAPTARRLFEARWRVDDEVTVRAQLTTYDAPGRRRGGSAVAAVPWVIAAEAERPWDLDWLSPATVFWPDSDLTLWDHDVVPGPRLRSPHRLTADDDKDLRRLLRNCTRSSWNIHVVVHEAMTPDARGLESLTRHLPPGLRHRVVEHRATPEQFDIVNWAIKDLHVRVPRGGAVVLPSTPPVPGYDADRFAVRSVFLDGSEPAELVERITEFASLPRPLTAEAEQAVEQLRRRWHLLTVEEELARTRELVTKYADALDAMTKSRDLYREAAELAQAALAERGESAPLRGHLSVPAPHAPSAAHAPSAPPAPPAPPAPRPEGSALTATLTNAFGRFRDASRKKGD